MACDPWPITWACDIDCLSPATTGTAATIAGELLWTLSGRQFGLCDVTWRPCRRDCTDPWPFYGRGGSDYSYPLPALIGGLWFNLTCGSCGDTCSCTELSEVVLPSPVQSITSVIIDDVPLVTGAYRVDNQRLLVRTDGGRFPYCNNLAKNTGVGTWSVTARHGSPVPTAGALAAGELACELAKALNNETCRLPRGVTSVARQGITINYANVTDLLSQGLTGLYLVDQFLRAYNPHGLTERASVYNIDAPPPRITTWPGA